MPVLELLVNKISNNLHYYLTWKHLDSFVYILT